MCLLISADGLTRWIESQVMGDRIATALMFPLTRTLETRLTWEPRKYEYWRTESSPKTGPYRIYREIRDAAD